MANTNVVKEVGLEVKFLELSQKAFYEDETSILLKDPKRPNTKSSKIAGLSTTLFS